MTVKLVVLYARPDDPEAFERHYRDVHLPLSKAMPGVLDLETGRALSEPDGQPTYYRLTELRFADRAALDAAVRSEAGTAAEADFREIAPPGSGTFVVTVDN